MSVKVAHVHVTVYATLITPTTAKRSCFILYMSQVQILGWRRAMIFVALLSSYRLLLPHTFEIHYSPTTLLKVSLNK
jgi:hypothetical protein